MKNTNLIVAGVGGQGSILASHIIAEAAILHAAKTGAQVNVRVGETFGAAMRGGAVASHVRIGDVYGPLVSDGEAELVLAMEPLEALRIGVKYLAPNGIAIMNDQPLAPADVKTGAATYPSIEEIVGALKQLGKNVIAINATDLATKAGNSKALSVVMLGAAFASGMLPYDKDTMMDTIKRRVPARFIEANIKAFEMGIEAFGQAV